MVNKIAVCIPLLFTLLTAGEHRIVTGNLAWDLMQRQDSVVASSSVMHQPLKVNPFMHGLYSMVLPGAGQWVNDQPTKAVVFLAAEVLCASYAVYANRQGDQKTAAFQKYADEHWSPVRYAQWINVYGVSDYGPAAVIDLAKVRNFDFNEINAWERGTHTEGFSHALPKHGEQQYYELIGKYNQYKFGWDTYPQDVNGVPVSDGKRYDDMIPQQLLNYAADRGKANDQYYASSFAVRMLLLNHLLSAIDAYFAGERINRTVSAGMNIRQVETEFGPAAHTELTLSLAF